MKTISQLVAEVHATEHEYLKSTLIGPQEILAFATALRAQVIDECIATVESTWTNNREVIVSNLQAIK